MKLFFRLPGHQPALTSHSGRRAGDGKRKPSALSGKRDTIFLAKVYILSLPLPRRAVFFLPITPAPHSDAGSPLRGRFQPVGLTGRRVGSPSRRPMGKKNPLCPQCLCGEIFPKEYVTVFMNRSTKVHPIRGKISH